MGKQIYRAPLAVGEAVRDAIAKGITSPYGEQLTSGDPISLTIVKDIYTKCRAGNEGYGGEAGLRWSRRILRQKGLLKSGTSQGVSIPQLLDLQLGPNIFVGVTELEIEKVSELMIEEGVSCCCIPLAKGALVFFPATSEYKTDGLIPKELPIKKILTDSLVLIDENRDRLKAIIKAVGTTSESQFQCFKIGNPEVLSSDIFTDFYLLKSEETLVNTTFIKVDEELGIVFGWGVICTEFGKDHFDTQGDHATDQGTLVAAADYMMNSRVAGEMHMRDDKDELIHRGTVVFAWPMTKDIAEAFGYHTDRTGLMIGLKPSDPEILAKYKTGEYTGFSIGGFRIPEHTEEVD